MSSGERYVFAAYAVVLAAVLLYLVIIALKVSRLERDLAELARLARKRAEEPAREEAAVG
jgi:heme exporter protein D